jgi:hypothetical protein
MGAVLHVQYACQCKFELYTAHVALSSALSTGALVAWPPPHLVPSLCYHAFFLFSVSVWAHHVTSYSNFVTIILMHGRTRLQPTARPNNASLAGDLTRLVETPSGTLAPT